MGELALFSSQPLPGVPMCLDSARSDRSPSSPFRFALYLALFFSFLCIAGELSFCASGSLFASRGCVSICCYFSPSLSSLFLSCLFVFISVSVSISTSFSVCVSLCMSLSVFLGVSPLSSRSLLPPPHPPYTLLFLCLSLSLCLSRPHFLPSCLPAALCAWPAPTAAGSGERVRSDCPGGHLMD